MASQIMAANLYDFSHHNTVSSISTQASDLVTKIDTLRDAIETQNNNIEGQSYYLEEMKELISGGIEPPNIDRFVETVNVKITNIQATPEYIAANNASNSASGNTGNTGSGGKTDEVLIDLNATSSNIIAISRGLDCVGCTVPLDLRDLMEYGCWCNMGPRLTEGQSAPLDKFDEACKSLQFCMRCTMMDNAELASPEDVCDPKLNLYNVPFFFFGTLEQSCGLVNALSTCNTRFCMCQTQWVWTVLDLSLLGETVREDLMQSNVNFDYETSCPVSGNPNGSGSKDLMCCGNYPYRTPYNAVRLECCDNSAVYNPNVSACCTDGVKTIGAC